MAKFVFKAKKSPKKPIHEARETYSKRRENLRNQIANFSEEKFEADLDNMDERNQKLSDAIAELERQLGLPVGGGQSYSDDI